MNSAREILEAGATLSQNKQWTTVNNVFQIAGLSGTISKLEIGGHDIYLQLSWWESSIVRIDITFSRGGQSTPGTTANSELINTLDTSRFDLARSALEDMCKRASDLLQSGTVGIGYFVRDWMGRGMYPYGYCPQLGTMVKGPTDAVARLIKQEIVRWTRQNEAEEALKKDAVADG